MLTAKRIAFSFENKHATCYVLVGFVLSDFTGCDINLEYMHCMHLNVWCKGGILNIHTNCL
jgi:hypothetical protein